MTTAKKKILITKELQESPLGIFFQNVGFELSSEFSAQQKDDYQFIINDHYPEVSTIPRIKIDPSITFTPQIEKNIRGVFDSAYLSDIHVQKLLKLFFSKEGEFSLVDDYSKGFEKILTLKIHEYLNIGYFTDTIVSCAYKNEFNIDLIRKYLYQLFDYSFHQIEASEVHSPLEVVYSCSEEVFTIEVSFTKADYNIKSDLGFESELAKEFANNSNYFCVNYFAKRSKVTLSTLWFKESSVKNFHSSFLSEISHKSNASSFVVPVVLGIEEAGSIQYIPQAGHAQEFKEMQGRKLSLARKFALFIRNFRRTEVDVKDVLSLTMDDIDVYLGHYPRQEALKEIDQEVKECVLKLVKDEKFFEGITEFIQKIAASNLDPQVDQIQKILAGKSLEDIEETIRISGVTSHSKDENTLVKGWMADCDQEDIRISGVTQTSKDEKWNVKRSEIAGKIQEEHIRIKADGRNISQDDIIRVVAHEMHTDAESVSTVVKGIVEEAVTSEITQKNKLDENFASRFVALQSAEHDRVAREKLEIQIARMKKVMELMKTEILASRLIAEGAKAARDSSEPSNEGDLKENNELKNAFTKSVEMLRNKEKMLLKQKSDFEHVLHAKDQKIITLETRIEQIKTDYANSSEFANHEKLEMLQSENKSLHLKLELANRKINIISENMNKNDLDEGSKKDREIASLKSNMQVAQSLIEKFKQERKEVDNRLADEKEKFSKLKDVKSSGEPAKSPAVDTQITDLIYEKRSLEEKFKLQNIELKKMEQKLKFTMAQLEESQRKRAAPTATATKSNETYIKQLEQAKGRIEESGKDLTERKKEIMKLKQENNILTGKLTELERKLMILEKKAA
jgi:hypothetical protein